MSRACLLAALLVAPFTHTEMTAPDDEQLSDVQGADIGFVLDSAMVDDNKATITTSDVTNTATGQNVPIAVKELCVAATGSNKGNTLTPVTLGRFNFPFKLNLAKGSVLTTQLGDGRVVSTLPDTMDVVGLTFPSLVSGANGQPYIAGYADADSNCLNRTSERVDASIRLDFGVTSTHTDVLSLDFSELAINGSYLRFWGANVRSQLVDEMRLDLYARTFEIMSYGAGSPSCISAAEQAARTVYLTNAYASVTLGYRKSQSLLFSVIAGGNFTFELPKLTLADATDFYADAPRTSLMIESPSIGDARSGYGQVPTGGYDMDRSEISGLSFNYLKTTSHNLQGGGAKRGTQHMTKQTHPLTGGIGVLAALALLFNVSAGTELRSLGDNDLDDVVGRAGISISASLNLRENPSQTCCAGGYGARLMIRPASNGNNYLVINDISGEFSFDEVALDVVTIKDGFGGGGATFNRPVLRVDLEDASFQSLRFIIADVNRVRGTDPGLVQANLVSARTDGTLKLQDNVNIFTVAPR